MSVLSWYNNQNHPKSWLPFRELVVVVMGVFIAKHPYHQVHQPMCLVVGLRNKAVVNIDRHGVAEQPFPNPDVRPEIVVIGIVWGVVRVASGPKKR